MKIRHRLALRFMMVSGLFTGLILLFIYIVTNRFVHDDFILRLDQQSRLEVLHFATPNVRDVMPVESFSLVNPDISIFSASGELLYVRGEYTIPSAWINVLKNELVFDTEADGVTTLGRVHEINGITFYVFISDVDLPGQRELSFLLRAVIGGWLVSLVLSFYAGLFFSRQALDPVAHVVEEVNQISEDNLSYRLKAANQPDKVDEIDELVITFNDLLNRIENAFIAQRRFLQNASHELKTPLTSIIADVELTLSKDRASEEYKRVLAEVLNEAERLALTTQGLLALMRLEEGNDESELGLVGMVSLLTDTLHIFSQRHPERLVEKQIEIEESVNVRGNKQLLETALLNVLDNAQKYSEDVIKVSLSRMDKLIVIVIQDYGIGIPPDELDRIKTPLVRASNVGGVSGAGLGLALVDRILKAHHGTVEIASSVGKGTTCVLRLPVEGMRSRR